MDLWSEVIFASPFCSSNSHKGEMFRQKFAHTGCFIITVHILTLTAVYRYETPYRKFPWGILRICPGAMEIMQYSIYNSSDLGGFDFFWKTWVMSDSSPKSLGMSNRMHMFQAQMAFRKVHAILGGWNMFAEVIPLDFLVFVLDFGFSYAKFNRLVSRQGKQSIHLANVRRVEILWKYIAEQPNPRRWDACMVY